MPRFICSICSAPPDVLQAVNNALLAGESGRKIAARSAFSKSALYRHRDKCIARTTLAKHRQLVTSEPGRHIVVWPSGDYTIATPRREPELFDICTLQPHDIVIRVEYAPAEETRNPAELIDEALREDAERFPIADLSDPAECKRVDEGPKD
jgi:hypothetical protein